MELSRSDTLELLRKHNKDEGHIRHALAVEATMRWFARKAGADEDLTLARLRTLRSDLIDPTIAVHHGRVVKRTATWGKPGAGSPKCSTPPSGSTTRFCWLT